jgi:hypothetical protein
MLVWFSIVIATLSIQIPNIWAIKKFEESPSFLTAFYIGLFCIPFGIISTTFYSYYYGFGFQKFSYPILIISAMAFSLLTSFFVQSFILKNKTIIFADYISIFFVISGLMVMIYRTEITQFIK